MRNNTSTGFEKPYLYTKLYRPTGVELPLKPYLKDPGPEPIPDGSYESDVKRIVWQTMQNWNKDQLRKAKFDRQRYKHDYKNWLRGVPLETYIKFRTGHGELKDAIDLLRVNQATAVNPHLSYKDKDVKLPIDIVRGDMPRAWDQKWRMELGDALDTGLLDTDDLKDSVTKHELQHLKDERLLRHARTLAELDTDTIDSFIRKEMGLSPNTHQEVLQGGNSYAFKDNPLAMFERRADNAALKGKNLDSAINYVRALNRLEKASPGGLSNKTSENLQKENIRDYYEQKFAPMKDKIPSFDKKLETLANYLYIPSPRGERIDAYEPKRIKNIIRQSMNSAAARSKDPNRAKAEIARQWANAKMTDKDGNELEDYVLGDQLRSNLANLAKTYDESKVWGGFFSERDNLMKYSTHQFSINHQPGNYKAVNFGYTPHI